MEGTKQKEKDSNFKYIYIKGHHIVFSHIVDWHTDSSEKSGYIDLTILTMAGEIKIQLTTFEVAKFGEIMGDTFDQLIYIS
jgi:hypothetical protein